MPEPLDEFADTADSGDLEPEPDSAPVSAFDDEGADYPSDSPLPTLTPVVPDNLSPAEEEKVIRDAVRKQVRQERIAEDAREQYEEEGDEEEEEGPTNATTVTDADWDELTGLDDKDVMGDDDDDDGDFSDITSISDEDMADMTTVTSEDVQGTRPRRKLKKIVRRPQSGEQFGGVGRVGY